MKINKFRLSLILWLVILSVAALLAQCASSDWSWDFSKTIEVTGHTLEDKNDPVLLTLRGKKFGKQRNKTQILLNGKELDPSHILKWRDREIQIFMRKPFNYALVQLKRNSKLSELIPIWNPAFLPQLRSPNKTEANYPILEKFRFVSETVVEVRGKNFGSRFTKQMLLLSRQPENDQNLYFRLPMLENYRPLKREEILLWNDSTMQFILPQETTEGPIYLLRQNKNDLQISNNLYIPAARKFQQTANKPVKMRLSLSFPQNIVSNIFPDNEHQPSPSSEPKTYIPIQWPRNTLNQRWAYTLESKSLNLPIELVELQPLSSKLARSLKLSEKSWLAVEFGNELAPSLAYLDFFHSSWQQEVPLKGRNRSYTERELQLYAALLWRNPSLTAKTPTWAHGVPDNLSPYLKALELYRRILQHFSEEQIPKSWPKLQHEVTQEILLLFLDSLTRLKIPARIIAGAISSKAALEPYFWVEIYFPEFGWFQVDLLAELSNEPSNSLQYWGSLDSANFLKIAFFALRHKWQDYNINKNGIRWDLQILDS